MVKFTAEQIERAQNDMMHIRDDKKSFMSDGISKKGMEGRHGRDFENLFNPPRGKKSKKGGRHTTMDYIARAPENVQRDAFNDVFGLR